MSLVALLTLTLAATGCKKGDPAAGAPLEVAGAPQSTPSLLSPPGPSRSGDRSTTSTGTSSGISTGTGSGTGSGSGGPTPSAFTDDDLKTYGYAFADEATLADDLSAVTAALSALQTDVWARDVSGAEADANELLAGASRLDADATAATRRMEPVAPSDPDLQRVRGDALSAFGLTEEYAGTAVSLANAATSLDLHELASVAQQAIDLAGTSGQLTASYADLSSELAAFAQANPQAAAKALAAYGR